MSRRERELLDVGQALEQLKDQIRRRYPTSEFAVAQGDDPAGIYLYVILAVEEEELDRFYEDDEFLDLLDDIEGERDLPIYVFTTWPQERIQEEAIKYLALKNSVPTSP